MNAQREAFDLTHKPCRNNFIRALRLKKYYWSWWRLVISDTWNRVCSSKKVQP